MLQSLQNTVSEPSGTKAAIRQALMSPAGLRVAWVVVEAEEDVTVYEKFRKLSQSSSHCAHGHPHTMRHLVNAYSCAATLATCVYIMSWQISL